MAQEQKTLASERFGWEREGEVEVGEWTRSSPVLWVFLLHLDGYWFLTTEWFCICSKLIYGKLWCQQEEANATQLWGWSFWSIFFPALDRFLAVYSAALTVTKKLRLADDKKSAVARMY